MIEYDKPSTHSVSQLTHPTSEEIESKFRFFADCLQLINLKAGEYCYFEVETHISLIKSLQYSVESGHLNYSKKVAKSLVNQVQYILQTHPLMNSKDRLISQFYVDTIVEIEIIKGYSGCLKADLIKIDNALKQLLQKLSSEYIENVVKELTRCITCNHTLKFHKKDLDYFARIIFSFFYLKDYSRREIETFISKLLGRNVEREGNRIYTDGLLPIDLDNRVVSHNISGNDFDQELFNEVEDSFKNRSTGAQLAGFVSLAKYQKNEYSFIFKADGIYIDEKEVEIDGLLFLNTANFLKENKELIKDSRVRDFLNIPSVLFISKVRGYTQSDAVYLAITELKSKLDRIGFILNRRINLDVFAYLIQFDDGHYWLNEVFGRTRLSEWEIKNINFRNTSIKKKEFSDFLQEKEVLLYNAFGEVNLGKSLHDYSKFVEQLSINSLSGIKRGNGIPERILAMAYLLLLTEEDNFKLNIRKWCYNVIINSIPIQKIGAQHDTNLLKFRNKRILPSFNEMGKAFVHPHFRYRINVAYDSRKRNSQASAFHYYVRYLLMLIRYRNIQEHMNLSERQFARKLKLSINIVCNRVVVLLSKEFNKKENFDLTPENVLSNLILKGQEKADSLGITLVKEK